MSTRYAYKYESFQRYLRGGRVPLLHLPKLLAEEFLNFVEFAIRNLPGMTGILVRRCYYKMRLQSLGHHTIIDTGVYFYGAKNIIVGNWTWIDSGVRIEAFLGEITIGNRIHIASGVIIGAREPIIIEDFAAIGAGAKVYSNSVVPSSQGHMSGPMIPEEFKSYVSKPISIGRDSVIGANAVLLPGASLGQGSILGSLSLLKDNIPPWDIWGGVPAKNIGKRSQLTSEVVKID